MSRCDRRYEALEQAADHQVAGPRVLSRDHRVAEIAQPRVNPEADASLQQIFHRVQPKRCPPFEQPVEHRHVVAAQ